MLAAVAISCYQLPKSIPHQLYFLHLQHSFYTFQCIFYRHSLAKVAVVRYCSLSLSVSTTLDPYDSDKMAAEFLMQFPKQAFSVGQQLVFQFQDKKMLMLTVKEMEGLCNVSFSCTLHVAR